MSNKSKKKSIRNFDYKRAFKRKSEHSMLKKIGMTVVAANIMVAPVGTYIQDTDGQTNVAEAASLGEVQLLTDVNIDANLTDSANSNYYNLNLGLTGTGLADVELASPERTVVFHAPELAQSLEHSGGTATVQVETLPINLQEDLPALYDTVGGLTDTLTGLVNDLVSGVNDAIPPELVNIEGLEELNTAIDNLNNLDASLQNLTNYSDEVNYTITEDGAIVVEFSDGIGNHLETAVVDTVQSLLDDVSTAANNLEIELLGSIPGIGDLVDGVMNEVLLPIVGTITDEVTNVSGALTDGSIDLANSLASAQVIGNTSVNLDVLVDNPAGVQGEVPVQGAGIQDSVIDAALLSSLQSQDTITFDEDVTAPALGSADIDGNSVDGYNVFGEAGEPGDTVVVSDPEGVEVGTGTIGENGTYDVALAPDAVGAGEQLTVTAVDEAGNESDPLNVTVPDDQDATPPELGSA
ncbi:adhesive domain-containing protein, partial [Salinicoccus albus]|uniref:adhesive domain-containing protein n=1 Tax=Salinicoccus albus TaxID=418756 RepID=UPI00038254DA